MGASNILGATAFGPIIAAAITLPVALSAIDNLPVGVVHDDGMYTVLAKALATGQGYRWLNIPGAPAATHYPPGYPALLALVWRIFPDFPANVVAFKALNAVLLAFAAAMIVLFARRRFGFSPRAATAIAIAGCLAVPTLVLSTIVMSEMFFLALLLPALLLAERAMDDESISVGRALSFGAAGGALMLVRTHGVAFVIAVVVALLLRRDVRAFAASLAASIVVVMPWQLWQGAHPNAVAPIIRGDYGSYGGWLLGGASSPVALALRTVGATSRELFAMFATVTTAGLPLAALRLLAVLAVIAMTLAGVWRAWNRARVSAIFLVAYVGIVLVWPFTPARFLWGIWPLLTLIAVSGAALLRDWRPTARGPRVLRMAAGGCLALAVVGSSVYTLRGYRGRWWSSIPRSTVAVAWPTVVWVSEHSRPGDVLATNVELMTYLYTGRHAVPATTFSVADYFVLPSTASRDSALRSILEAYRIDAVAIVANDSLELAARRNAAGPRSVLVLRDSVPHGLILTPLAR